MDPIKVLKLFQAIPLQDRELLQTPYPERFILSHFIVPPLCIRPSVLMSHGAGRFFFLFFFFFEFEIFIFIIFSSMKVLRMI